MRPRKWQTLNRKRAMYRHKFRPVFSKALELQIKPLYELIERESVNNIEIPILDNEPIRQSYEKLYKVVAIDMAKEDRALAKSLKRQMTLKADERLVEDLVMSKIAQYIEAEVGMTIVELGDTSRIILERLVKDLSKEILEQGIGASAAQTMLRDRIKSEWHRVRYYRTERIVRTEVGRAANWGSIEGVRTLEAQMNKHWVSAMSSNSRDEHIAASGQKRDIEEPFNVGGELLDFPGDPAGSAANTINCMCAITYSDKTEI